MNREPTIQCEGCRSHHPESDMVLEEVPGATLAFCPSCVEPPRHVQYGVRR